MKKSTLIGYLGLILLQATYVPAIMQAMRTGHTLPPESLAMLIIGLSCYLYNSIQEGNLLYTIGNAIGLVGNVTLLGLVLIK